MIKMNGARREWSFIFGVLFISLFIVYLIIPSVKFNSGFSTVIYSNEGILLGAKIAKDEQWRFPTLDSIPPKYKQAILLFEDKRFEQHKGVDILRIAKAFINNLSSKKRISGASTINMQLARLFRSGKERSYINKLIETLIALKLDLQKGKNEILNLYAAHAPFGGNVVGLETASWRYFGKRAYDLTWAETSTLAVLPNSPALIHPGRNRSELRKKRDALLLKLKNHKIIDDDLYELSLLEEIPEKPLTLPQANLHLLARIDRSPLSGSSQITSIDSKIQDQIISLSKRHQLKLEQNGIHNMAIIVMENDGGKVLGYLGNTAKTSSLNHEHFVDMISANRSSGSIIKPLLYALAIDEGLITQNQLLPDIPGRISGYRPRNFSRSYDGAVKAKKALARSLNVPAVYLLQQYSIDIFLLKLKDFGINSIRENADHYGLPLILGGADVNLWELAGVYSSMARILNNYQNEENLHSQYLLHPPEILKNPEIVPGKTEVRSLPLSAGAIWLTFLAMTEVERPDEQGNWEEYNSSAKIAWKTGTSFKHKDAWSIGVSRDFTVGVWVGNATGEGRPGLVGIKSAAPILFDVFAMLAKTDWFDEPDDDLKEIEVCLKSGYPASGFCNETEIILQAFNAQHKTLCPYHKIVNTDLEEEWLLDNNCAYSGQLKQVNWFVLPPLMEHFYAKLNPEYKVLPPNYPGCESSKQDILPMSFIYPSTKTKILIPLDYDKKKGKAVFRLAHRDRNSKVFWYINNDLIAETFEFHEVEISRKPGKYLLLVVDDKGNELKQTFTVVK